MNLSSAPWLIAITAGRWQLNGIRSAQSAGVNVLAVDEDPNAPGLAISDYALCAPLDDLSVIKQVILDLGISPSGAVSFCSDAGVPTVADLREHFGLPGLQGEALLAFCEKDKQRSLWSRAGVPVPRWALFRSVDEFKEQVKKIGFPCIVKPTDSAGSRGISVLKADSAGIEHAARHALTFSKLGKGIVERYFQGAEYTIETFSQNSECYILAITEKKKVPGTSETVANELRTVSSSAKEYETLTQVTRLALNSLGLFNGPAHTEVILSSNQSIIVVETAARGGGFNVFDRMIPAVTGFDIAKATADISIGRTVRIPRLKSNCAILRFFPSRAGKISRLDGFDKNWTENTFFSEEGVEAGAFASVGHDSRVALSDGDRLGYVLSWAKDMEQAERLATKREKQITVETEGELK